MKDFELWGHEKNDETFERSFKLYDLYEQTYEENWDYWKAEYSTAAKLCNQDYTVSLSGLAIANLTEGASSD